MSDKSKQILDRLNAKYPDVHLSFGYIGNCGISFDDRSWGFFTRVPMPLQKHCFSYGWTSTDKLDEFLNNVEEKLDQWIATQVFPHVTHCYRSFEVNVQRHFSDTVEKMLKSLGADFTVKGCGHFVFYIQFKTLVDLQELLLPFGLLKIQTSY
jgi:hypothetical protein